MVGPVKNCKSFVFRTMLFLKVSKTIDFIVHVKVGKISIFPVTQIFWTFSMLIVCIHRYVCHCQKFSCNYFPLWPINGTGLLDYKPHDHRHTDKFLRLVMVILYTQTYPQTDGWTDGRTDATKCIIALLCWSCEATRLMEILRKCHLRNSSTQSCY